jgi:hypothetical protein
MADVKRNMAITNERMLIGALVNAYSRPVIDAKISLNAIKMYLDAFDRDQYTDGEDKIGVTHEPVCIHTFRGETRAFLSASLQVAAE